MSQNKKKFIEHFLYAWKALWIQTLTNIRSVDGRSAYSTDWEYFNKKLPIKGLNREENFNFRRCRIFGNVQVQMDVDPFTGESWYDCEENPEFEKA